MWGDCLTVSPSCWARDGYLHLAGRGMAMWLVMWPSGSTSEHRGWPQDRSQPTLCSARQLSLCHLHVESTFRPQTPNPGSNTKCKLCNHKLDPQTKTPNPKHCTPNTKPSTLRPKTPNSGSNSQNAKMNFKPRPQTPTPQPPNPKLQTSSSCLSS